MGDDTVYSVPSQGQYWRSWVGYGFVSLHSKFCWGAKAICWSSGTSLIALVICFWIFVEAFIYCFVLFCFVQNFILHCLVQYFFSFLTWWSVLKYDIMCQAAPYFTLFWTVYPILERRFVHFSLRCLFFVFVFLSGWRVKGQRVSTL